MTEILVTNIEFLLFSATNFLPDFVHHLDLYSLAFDDQTKMQLAGMINNEGRVLRKIIYEGISLESQLKEIDPSYEPQFNALRIRYNTAVFNSKN